ncbi:hypothetical protein, partial [uncultured Methanobrevibacter sp.]|uniref:hypothetical protein n=1 Tax=uncultured Methanobrevibacter sp. TaxID=253161 RepID=UPI0025E78D74
MNELSLETNDNKTHSSDDVLKVSHNSPLGADPSNGTFDDIQKAINATVGGTVFLNGTNYTGNKQITINKDIIIDGANSQGNGVSILDAKSASRIFYSSVNYNIVLKNLIFENPILNTNGYCAYFNGGNITIQNVTIRNINGTSKPISSKTVLGAIYLGKGSTLNASNLTFKSNSINYEDNYYRNLLVSGLLLWVGQSSNVELNNLNIYDNNISFSYSYYRYSRETIGFVYVDGLSNVSMSDVNFKNNTIKIDTNQSVNGILLRVGQSSNVELNNLNIFDNNISAQITNLKKRFYGFVYVDRLSNVSISDVNYCNNYLDVKDADIDGGFFYGLNGTFNLSNLNFEDNIVLNYTNMRSFIRAVTNSNIVLTNVHFYRNYVSGVRNVGTILSVIDSRALVNYCYIEDNCVNNTLTENSSKINQAGFISIQGV